MSSWQEIDLTNVPTDIELLPEKQDFVFELLPGARYGKFDANRIEAAGKVVGSEFAGRVRYFSYPDPAKQSWSAGVFVRMVKALGVELEPGQDPVDYLVANAGKQFVSQVKHRPFTNEGVEGFKDEIAIGNVKPVRA